MRSRQSCLLVALVAIAPLASCQGSEPERQHASLGPISYDMPADWQRNDRGPITSVWTPPDNARKESVTIVRADLDPELATAGLPALAELLVKAQGSLPGAHVSIPEAVTTSRGLHGFRVDVDFAPLAGKPHYTRVHTILLDGMTLVHVLYTAASPDPESQALKMALDTAHKEG